MVKKLVIYRDKQTNEIKGYHDWNEKCTQEAVDNFNSNENNSQKAEIYEYEENSVEEFFIKGYKASLRDWYAMWENISSDISSLSSTIEDISYDCKKVLDKLDNESL